MSRTGRGRCDVRRRRRLVGGALLSTLAVALITACGGSTSASAPSAPSAASAAAGPLWLCRPGQAADPCAASLAATAVTAGGTVSPIALPSSAVASKFDCFYVHPTDSLAKTANTGPVPTKLDIYVATEQGAPLSQVCDVWAPAYRSQTWSTVEKFPAGDKAVMRPTFTVAYDSVLPAWQWFLAHTGGKPIILIGDSQGSAILIHLISARSSAGPARA